MVNNNFSLYNKKLIDRIEKKINFLGVNSKYTAINFLNMRLITSIFFFVFIFSFFKYGYILAVVFVVFVLYFAISHKSSPLYITSGFTL